ncbi:hypothetical protein FB451DRAFT_1364524 [Mycena latifolia]|nr:hypothetical protein FB451DRAFT_1364524 [Mycena latifolia]
MSGANKRKVTALFPLPPLERPLEQDEWQIFRGTSAAKTLIACLRQDWNQNVSASSALQALWDFVPLLVRYNHHKSAANPPDIVEAFLFQVNVFARNFLNYCINKNLRAEEGLDKLRDQIQEQCPRSADAHMKSLFISHSFVMPEPVDSQFSFDHLDDLEGPSAKRARTENAAASSSRRGRKPKAEVDDDFEFPEGAEASAAAPRASSSRSAAAKAPPDRQMPKPTPKPRTTKNEGKSRGSKGKGRAVEPEPDIVEIPDSAEEEDAAFTNDPSPAADDARFPTAISVDLVNSALTQVDVHRSPFPCPACCTRGETCRFVRHGLACVPCASKKLKCSFKEKAANLVLVQDRLKDFMDIGNAALAAQLCNMVHARRNLDLFQALARRYLVDYNLAISQFAALYFRTRDVLPLEDFVQRFEDPTIVETIEGFLDRANVTEETVRGRWEEFFPPGEVHMRQFPADAPLPPDRSDRYVHALGPPVIGDWVDASAHVQQSNQYRAFVAPEVVPEDYDFVNPIRPFPDFLQRQLAERLREEDDEFDAGLEQPAPRQSAASTSRQPAASTSRQPAASTSRPYVAVPPRPPARPAPPPTYPLQPAQPAQAPRARSPPLGYVSGSGPRAPERAGPVPSSSTVPRSEGPPRRSPPGPPPRYSSATTPPSAPQTGPTEGSRQDEGNPQESAEGAAEA